MKRSKDKQVQQFLKCLLQLEVIETIGVARLLKVDLVTREEGTDADDQPTATITEKEADIIMSEIIDAYIAAPKATRKWILQLVKDATAKV